MGSAHTGTALDVVVFYDALADHGHVQFLGARWHEAGSLRFFR